MVAAVKIMVFLFVVGGCSTARQRLETGSALNEYRYVISTWQIGSPEYEGFKQNPDILRNDYYAIVNKSTSQPKIIYFFEEKGFRFALKLVVYLANSSTPKMELWHLLPDKKSCGRESFAMDDFRRQSCYFKGKDLWQGKTGLSIDQAHSQVLQSIDRLQ